LDHNIGVSVTGDKVSLWVDTGGEENNLIQVVLTGEGAISLGEVLKAGGELAMAEDAAEEEKILEPYQRTTERELVREEPVEGCGKTGCTNPGPHVVMGGNINYRSCDEHLEEITKLCERG
jgi:hypothetical protein